MSRQAAAIVLILDAGHSELLPLKEGEKFLQTSRECASMIIQSKLFTNSKDVVGLILMGSEDNYVGKNIKIAFKLAIPTWHAVRKVQKVTMDCDEYIRHHEADWVEAVNVALDLLRNDSGKYSDRRIVVFSSNLKLRSLSNLTNMECGIQDLVVDLYLIHPEVTDDPIMSKLKREVDEAINIIIKVEGMDMNIEEAAVQLLSFQKKKVKPQAWNVCLDIGSKIGIPVTGYKKINEGQALKWQDSPSSVAQSEIFPAKLTPSIAESLLDTDTRVLRKAVHVRGDGTEVERDEIIQGYHFGSTIVPFTEEDKQQLKYVSGEKCLSVVKVTKRKFVPRHFWTKKSCTCLVARDNDENAAIAFSALVQALDQMESVAIVRRLYYSGTKPHMGALFPVIKPTKEYLAFVELPFSNCMRKCLLPELKINHLTVEQFDAIDRLIDEMDLSEPGDEDSISGRQWSGLLVPHKVFDPYLQHVRRCVASRILNPQAPLPSLDDKLYKMLTEPPQQIKEAVSNTLYDLSKLFPNLEPDSDLTKKGKGKRNTTTRGADDITDGVQSAKQIKDSKEESEVNVKTEDSEIIGILTPVQDFKAAIEQNAIPVVKVCKQMQDVIVKLVLNSFGLLDFEKPKDCLRTLRQTVLICKLGKNDSIANFNTWMKELYQLLQENFKMGYWKLVMQEKLGFITSDECSESCLSVSEVNEMLGGDEINETLSEEEEMDLPEDL